MPDTAATVGSASHEVSRTCAGTPLDRATGMMNKLALVPLTLLAAAACSKSSAGDTAAPAVAIDLPGVNALVPKDLQAMLAFERREVIEDRGRSKITYTLAAPKGWKQSMPSFANLKGGDDVGFMTSLDVGSNCDGTCEAKDWAQVADKVNFKQFGDATVVKNETTATSRLLIADRGDTSYVMYAWWTTGARSYHTCMVTLEEPVRAAAPAFAKACQSVGVQGGE